MPVCYITVSDKVQDLSVEQIEQIRIIVAEGLDSRSRKLDKGHIAMRLQSGSREFMLGDIEIDIFAQLYVRRLFSRDRRANQVSKMVSELIDCSCATWINLSHVGYSRVSKSGGSYYSDSDNAIVRLLQKAKGIYTRESVNSSKGD